MEKNQSNTEVSTILLNEIYQDYKKTKRRQRFYSYIYYAVLIAFFGWVIAAISSFQSSFNKMQQSAEIYPDKFVAVVKLEGTIGDPRQGIVCERFNESLERAFNHEGSVAVLLDIDSGGGGVYDSYEIYLKIQSMKQQYPEKKVIAYVRSVAASGAYLIACAADEIYSSNAYTTVGSIGAYVATLNFNQFLKGLTIDPIFIHAGSNKGGFNPYQEITPEMLQETQKLLDDIHHTFIDIVKESRAARLNPNDRTFTGLAFSSKDGKEQGLIDGYNITMEELVQQQIGDYPIEYIRLPKKKFDDLLEEFVDRYSSIATKSVYESFMTQHRQSISQSYA